jgi:hypothetical protein
VKNQGIIKSGRPFSLMNLEIKNEIVSSCPSF